MVAPIKVLVIDDCAPLRFGIRQIFARTKGKYKLVQETCNGATALGILAQEQFEIVLMDSRLFDMHGTHFALRAQERGYKIPIIVYSAHDDYDDVIGMIKCGALGYVLKDESIENLLNAIAIVAAGGTWYSQKIAKKLVEWTKLQHLYTGHLTKAEIRVLLLLTEGKTNREIGNKLGLAERTVRFHSRNICDKLHLPGRDQVVQWGLANGYRKKILLNS